MIAVSSVASHTRQCGDRNLFQARQCWTSGTRHMAPAGALCTVGHAHFSTAEAKVRSAEPTLVAGHALNARPFLWWQSGPRLPAIPQSARGSRVAARALLSSWPWKQTKEPSSDRSAPAEKNSFFDGVFIGRRNTEKNAEVEEGDEEGEFSRNMSDVEKVFALSVAGVVALVAGQFLLRVLWGALGLVLLFLQYIAVAAAIILTLIFLI